MGLKLRFLPFYEGLVLLISILITVSFFIWIFTNTEDEQVHQVKAQYERLFEQGKINEAKELLREVLGEKKQASINPVWLPIIRLEDNGYEKLGYFMQVLKSDPDRKATYFEVAGFIELAPKAFHDEVKARYLADISQISGIRQEWLEEFNLKPAQSN